MIDTMEVGSQVGYLRPQGPLFFLCVQFLTGTPTLDASNPVQVPVFFSSWRLVIHPERKEKDRHLASSIACHVALPIIFAVTRLIFGIHNRWTYVSACMYLHSKFLLNPGDPGERGRQEGLETTKCDWIFRFTDKTQLTLHFFFLPIVVALDVARPTSIWQRSARNTRFVYPVPLTELTVQVGSVQQETWWQAATREKGLLSFLCPLFSLCFSVSSLALN